MPQCAVFDFRMNVDDLDNFQVSQELRKIAKKFCFQKEKGTKTGYLHYQGRLSLFKKDTTHGALKLFDDLEIPRPNYFQPTVGKEHQKESFYCMKAQTRIEGPWTDKDVLQYVPKRMRDIVLYPYQQKIWDNYGLDDRYINFVYNPKGGGGKSTIAILASLKLGYIYLPFLRDYEKLMEVMLCECLGKTNDPKCVIMDMPRAISKDKLEDVYGALESIKNGFLFDTRYHYKKCLIEPPNVWVFSNKPPVRNHLSDDRWRLWRINSDKDISLISWDYFTN